MEKFFDKDCQTRPILDLARLVYAVQNYVQARCTASIMIFQVLRNVPVPKQKKALVPVAGGSMTNTGMKEKLESYDKILRKERRWNVG